MAQQLDEECKIKGTFKGELHTCRHFDDVRRPSDPRTPNVSGPFPAPPPPPPALPCRA